MPPVKRKTKWLRGRKANYGPRNQPRENLSHSMTTECSKGTKIVKRQYDTYTFVSQIQIGAGSNYTEAAKIPGGVS